MPIEYAIRREEQLVECMAFGIFSDAQLREKQQQLSEDPDFQPTFRQIVDFTKVTKFELSTDGLRKVAANSVFAAGAARAIVAPTDLGFGLARMFDAFANNAGQTVRTFRSRTEAMTWLDSSKKPAA